MRLSRGKGATRPARTTVKTVTSGLIRIRGDFPFEPQMVVCSFHTSMWLLFEWQYRIVIYRFLLFLMLLIGMFSVIHKHLLFLRLLTGLRYLQISYCFFSCWLVISSFKTCRDLFAYNLFIIRAQSLLSLNCTKSLAYANHFSGLSWGRTVQPPIKKNSHWSTLSSFSIFKAQTALFITGRESQALHTDKFAVYIHSSC